MASDTDSAAVRVGDLAPDFETTAADGAPIKLSSFRGTHNVVLYFYPRDETPVCTKEACGFRDMYATLRDKDTQVIGVSTDDAESHRRFAAKHDLPYPLVSDPGRQIAKLYGAAGSVLGLIARTKRLTFVIDKSGRVVRVLAAELRAGVHIDGVREALASLG
ncbi:MAG: peroxiredoxin [Polyangiales bacterium]